MINNSNIAIITCVWCNYKAYPTFHDERDLVIKNMLETNIIPLNI